MKHYIGLDVSMKETFICIVNEQGKVVYEGKEITDPKSIAKHLKERGLDIEKVAIESGCISHWLVKHLQALDIPAICIDSRQMAAILSINVNKTDQNDAKAIANALRSNFYKQVTIKSDVSVEINVLLGSRKALVQQRTTLKNSIRGQLKAFGIRLSFTGKKSFADKVKESLTVQSELIKQVIDSLLVVFDTLNEQIDYLERNIKELASQDEDVKILTTIPGVGILTAMSFKAAVDDPKRFENSRSVGAYFGLTPNQYASGETQRQGRISKCGCKEMRSLLVEAATVMLTRTRLWCKPKAWALKIFRKKGLKKATVALARKLSVIMHRMLITKEPFRLGSPIKEEIKCLQVA